MTAFPPVQHKRRLRCLLKHFHPRGCAALNSPETGEFALESYSSAHAPPSYTWKPLTEDQVAAHVRALEVSGYTIIKDAIDPKVLADAHQACIEIYQKDGGGLGETMKERDGVSRQFLNTNLIGRDPRFWPLIGSSNVLRVIRGLIGEEAKLSSSQSRWTRPGCSEQLFHIDDGIYGREVFPRPLAKQLSCVALIALQDITAANGATKIFPESHTWAKTPITDKDAVQLTMRTNLDATGFHPLANQASEAWARENKKPAPIRGEMPAGSALLWVGGAWHGGGAYTDPTGPDRAACIFNFQRGFLRAEEEPLLNVPREVAMQMPVDCQRLCGYMGTDLGLGYLQDGRAPHRALGEEGGRKLREWNKARLNKPNFVYGSTEKKEKK